jgi:hypothetical protein
VFLIYGLEFGRPIIKELTLTRQAEKEPRYHTFDGSLDERFGVDQAQAASFVATGWVNYWWEPFDAYRGQGWVEVSYPDRDCCIQWSGGYLHTDFQGAGVRKPPVVYKENEKTANPQYPWPRYAAWANAYTGLGSRYADTWDFWNDVDWAWQTSSYFTKPGNSGDGNSGGYSFDWDRGGEIFGHNLISANSYAGHRYQLSGCGVNCNDWKWIDPTYSTSHTHRVERIYNQLTYFADGNYVRHQLPAGTSGGYRIPSGLNIGSPFNRNVPAYFPEPHVDYVLIQMALPDAYMEPSGQSHQSPQPIGTNVRFLTRAYESRSWVSSTS